MNLELLKSAVQSPIILREIYGDLVKPGIEQVGKALGTVLGLGNTILWPVQLLNEKSRIALELNLEKYRKKIENTPIEEICIVAPEIGVPIGEKLAYVTNDEISELYIELLSKASKSESVDVAHPSFVNIINSISPDEARLMRSFQHVNAVPFIHVRLDVVGTREWSSLYPMLLPDEYGRDLTFPKNLPAYISNFEGLGILNVRDDFYISDASLYKPLEDVAENRFWKMAETKKNRKLNLKRGKIEITSFGQLFLRACFSSRTR